MKPSRSADGWIRGFKYGTIVASGVLPAVVIVAAVVQAIVDDPEEQGRVLVQALIGGVLLGAPTALYALLISRRRTIVVVGAALVITVWWTVWSVFSDGGSTAGIKIILIPLLGVPLVLLGWIVQLWSRPPDE